MPTEPFRYRAFISYSHRDERWASWLHKALERYRVPRRLVGRETPAGIVPARVAPVFRDREELPTAVDLSRVVTAALEQSAAMIVICSPSAARSRWVNEEIKTFQRLGKHERIFCLIVAGAPEAVGEEQCFPDALKAPAVADAAPAEPIGADVRPGKDGRNAALLKIVAGLLGLGLDELVRRDLQRRNRRMVGITAAALAGMGIASVLAALAVIARNEAEVQRNRAEIEAATAQQTTEFLVQLFEVVDPGESRGNTITAREILDRGAARIDRDLAEQPTVRANLLRTMGRVYTGLGLYDPATALLERAQQLRAELDSAPTAEGVATANSLGLALYLKGEYAAAEEVYRSALANAQSLFPDGNSLVTDALAGIANLLSYEGDAAGAQALYADALEIDRRVHGEIHPDVARSWAGLGRALMDQGSYADSEAAFRRALEIRRQALGENHPRFAETLNELGALLYFSGDLPRAEAVFREAVQRYRTLLGDTHVEVSSILNNLGRVLLEQGKASEAEPLLAEALAIDRVLKVPGHDDFVFTLNNLALARLGRGAATEAVPLLEEARAIAETHDHRLLGQVWANLADVYARTQRVPEAVDAAAKARALLTEQYPSDHWHIANLMSIEAAAQAASGDAVSAEGPLVEGYEKLRAHWGTAGLFTRLAAERLATFYDARGDRARAMTYRALASP